MTATRRVHARWDPDARVSWAESDDVPGLVSEASTLDALTDNVAALVPELAALNGGDAADIGIELVVTLPHPASPPTA